MKARIAALAERLIALQRSQGRALIALEGRCASGKTTLAQALLEQLQLRCPQLEIAVLHMDDFFLRPEQRSAERRAIPGENVDHERFWDEVLSPVSRGESFIYRRYDCHTQTLQPPQEMARLDIAIVEGSYSCHKDLIGSYDVRLLLDISPELQRERIWARNGEEGWQRFSSLWIPLEERYLATLDLTLLERWPSAQAPQAEV